MEYILNSAVDMNYFKIDQTSFKSEPRKVLVLSKSTNYIGAKGLELENMMLNGTLWLISTSKLSDAITLIEENRFDVICIDYSAVGANTLTLLEYSTKTLELNIRTPKVVLTDSFIHISDKDRKDILCFASKVISKTAKYFSFEKIVGEAKPAISGN